MSTIDPPEDPDDVVPEALPDRAVDDEVDGGVDDEEEVVERYEHEEHRGQVVAPQTAAVVVVVFGLHVGPERLKWAKCWQNFVVLLGSDSIKNNLA